ncbi:MAG: DNA-binding response regulator [Planctomycetes bacterium RIFCSPHIGHO2_02_FULL_50_42]|nr:MAG: DNA-binding response regulator [Planctomycetes bacterium GWA2_50_13]OHB88954.1 MAG: DNA-binding response regulator [Planctomycetes bacterium RIFCSPHIGHO2_02_FULL_50_42]OHB92567.1 MAG: DNA-binding response regulator [Planctomycetes bacterium RIFCSPHIGHO2_12_FULL_51_37]OHB95438.1 MAG: DNA-binding response regulator [Planctomycetes bacterium RIFCSPLOWO2_02_FULL_50_16]OHC04835.1 MAG: DNA-binding response regulator [Planctomycetes bacterium RIFCSPLOWO2_12_FULL_50_35]HCN19542.1 DNA-binding r
MPKKDILIIEDEKDLVELIQYNLEKEGFRVAYAYDGEEGLHKAGSKHPALVLLDLMLPRLDGLEVCRRLKQDSKTADIPIIILSVKNSEADVVAGLELGVDDYITKPFSPRVLISRVRAVLRRSEREAGPKKHIKIDGLVIDASRHEVFLDGKNVVLTMTEFNLLRYLASRPGRVFTRDQLMSGVLGEDSMVVDRTIDVHVASLRKKLGRYATYIVTVRGLGYKFKD